MLPITYRSETGSPVISFGGSITTNVYECVCSKYVHSQCDSTTRWAIYQTDLSITYLGLPTVTAQVVRASPRSSLGYTHPSSRPQMRALPASDSCHPPLKKDPHQQEQLTFPGHATEGTQSTPPSGKTEWSLLSMTDMGLKGWPLYLPLEQLWGAPESPI